MSLFKKLINAAMLDLRGYTPQALGKIRAINAATIILPSDASNEFYEAYAQIAVNVAKTMHLPKDTKLMTYSGISEITNYTDDIIVSSGISVIHKIESDKPIEVICSGITIYDPETKINFISNSGVAMKAPFPIKNIKAFSVTETFNADFFNYIDDCTIVACGNCIELGKDVSVDVLKKKNICLVAGNSINCSKDVIGYVQTISVAGNRVNTYGK